MKKTRIDAKKSIFKKSASIFGKKIMGCEFENKATLQNILDSFSSTGFQAANLAKAIEIAKKMRKEKTFVFLGYTSNQVSCGNREIIRYLVQNNMVDCLVTTAGGVEEDIIKTKHAFLQGDFRADGAKLRSKGINRIGNIFVPNDRYIWFEQFFQPFLKELLDEQKKTQNIFTPSEIIAKMGKKINHKSSIYYWAQKNNIPVFCPSLMDGAIGDNVYFFNYDKKQELKIDIAKDHYKIIEIALDAKETGMIVLGSGVVKHTICNANLYREGAKYAIYMNTAPEFDGSDSGAEPEEAKSWGKLTANANTVKVVADTTITLPLLVAGAFAKKNNLQKIIFSKTQTRS